MRILQPFYNTSLACPQKTRYNANQILHAQGELMKKIAFFDIDGTLTNDEKKITADTLSTLLKFQEHLPQK